MKKPVSILMLSILILIVFISCQSRNPPSSSHAAEATVTVGNKTISLRELKSRFMIETVAVPEPHSDGLTSFKGFRVVPIFDTYFGNAWRKADAVLYTCADGFHADVPVAKILSANPILAFAFEDEKKPFTLINRLQGNENVSLAPFYLIWETQKHTELKADSAYIWPYQVTKLETIQYAAQYAYALPFKPVSAVQREGFEFTKNFCLGCHALNGQGGLKGPALWPNKDVIKKGYASFEKWVLDPQSVKPGTTMGALNPDLPLEKRKAAAKKIFAYLHALNKVKPHAN